MKTTLFTIFLIGTTISSFAQQAFYDVTQVNGNGLRFWQSDWYKIHMGNGFGYNYGPVTDFSIKMNMSPESNRGWTWGIYNANPIAAMNTQGIFQLAGSFYAGPLMSTSGNSGRVSVSGSSGELSISNRDVTSFYDSPTNGERWVIYSAGVSDGRLRFWSGGDKMVLTKDGNMSLGSSSFLTQTRFRAYEGGSSTSTWRGRIVSSGDNAAVVMGEWNNKASIGAHNAALDAWSDLYLQHSGGNVAIGTLTLGPQTKLHVYETGSSANMWRGRVVASGDGSAVVMGEVNGKASLGGHNAALTAWSDLCLNWGGGNVGVGTQNPTQKLTVNGTIYGKEVKVDLNVPGPDYVFEKDYKLPSLEEIKSYIDQHKHLPQVPSSIEMEQNGINLSEMNMILLKKVEELTLYVIELKKENQEIKKLLLKN